MNANGTPPARHDPIGVATFPVLAALLLVLATGANRVGVSAAVALVIVGIGITVALRIWGGDHRVSLALLPVLTLLAFLSAVIPLSVLNEGLMGLTTLVVLAWLADGAGRPRGALRRATDLLMLPAIGFALALGATLLLPPGELRVGIASLLLAAALVLVGLVLARPDLFRPSVPGEGRSS